MKTRVVKRSLGAVAVLLFAVTGLAEPFNADYPPVIPVGQDAYRMWDRWAHQRIGVRAYMRSTYDRTGHNNTADASHFLYQQAENFNVALDVEGTGALYFVRTNHWHGSPWHYEIDGVDHIVQETTTADPTRKIEGAEFIPQALFPSPLTYTYATTKGADLNYVPMLFEDRLRIAYSRTFYGTGYYIYHLFAPGAPLSRPVRAWDGKTPPDPAVLEFLDRAGTDLAPTDGAGLAVHENTLKLRRGRASVVAELGGAPAMLRKLSISAPARSAVDLGRARLRITWDGRDQPSVDAPVALFFGAGTLHNRDGREWLVKALPVTVRFADGRVHLDAYFPMPFFRSARIELVGGKQAKTVEDIRFAARTLPYTGPWNHVGYFHATYKDHGEPKLGHELVFLDTQGIEGAADWAGHFVGTSFIFTDRNVLTTLEGDPRFFFDDSRTPHAQGTGTEEWGGGGDYWGGRNMTLPFVGHPVGVVDASMAKDPEELIHSAYRYLLADLMPFGKRALIRFDHGGENESTERYRTVSYWYGLPSPSLVLTDTLDIGAPADEAAHGYHSPEATEPYEVNSRFEWGPDRVPLGLGHPLAAPRDYVEFEFEADKGRYDIWLESKTGEGLFDASAWMQFNDLIGTEALDPDHIATMGFGNIRFGGAPANAYVFSSWVPFLPPRRITFSRSGKQKLRIQPRSGRLAFSRVLLSPDRKRAPGRDVTSDAGEILITLAQVTDMTGNFSVADDPAAPQDKTLALGSEPAAVDVFPEQAMTGRRTEGRSEFTFKIRPDNHGVMLRRTLDYQFANQRARVSVKTKSGWEDAGIWYLAGSNTVYHSWPPMGPTGELELSHPEIITSNRRFRDDEFLLPVHLTRGQDKVRVRIEFAPRNPPLLPGRQPADSAWTAFAYQAYSFVMPQVVLDD